MQIGSEYLTSNTAIAFPLSDDQEIPEEVRRAIVDARIVIEQGEDLPVLTSLYIENNTCYAVVSGIDTPFSSSLTETGFNVVYSGTSCIVFDNNYLIGKNIPGASFSFSGSWRFCIKSVDIDVKKVSSISLVNYIDGDAVVINVDPGEISFKSGYSMQLNENSGVVINALPGAGRGYYPCGCEDQQEGVSESDDDLIKLYTKSGILKIQNDSCYDIIPDIRDVQLVYPGVGTYVGNEIYLDNKCTACCSCQQYVDKVNRLRTLANRVKEVGGTILTAKGTLNEKISDFNDLSSIHTGGVGQHWFAVITALKKNPSVGSIKGKLHIRAVATISNTTLCRGEMNITSFKCTADGTDYSFDENNCNWFMLGQTNSSVGMPPDDLAVDAGKTVKITGVCTIPGTPNTITVSIEGDATANDSSPYHCEDAEFAASTIC